MLPQSVLLIDHDEDSRFIFSSMLRHHGYQVTVATSGAEGLELALLLRPDIAVVDLDLPDVDGCDLIATLHDSPATAGARCVAVTTDIRPQTHQRASASGSSLLFMKPLEPSVLVRSLRAVLEPSFAA